MVTVAVLRCCPQPIQKGTDNMATEAKSLNTKETAEALGTTPRTLRVFLRASDKYTNAGLETGTPSLPGRSAR